MIATRAVLPAVVVQNFKTENVLVDLASEGSLRTGGASVIIGGLQGEQAVLNGRRATVVKDEGADLVAGAAVRVFGLTAETAGAFLAQLNGKMGRVSAYAVSEGRVGVELEHGDGRLQARRAHPRNRSCGLAAAQPQSARPVAGAATPR